MNQNQYIRLKNECYSLSEKVKDTQSWANFWKSSKQREVDFMAEYNKIMAIILEPHILRNISCIKASL